MMRFFLDGRRHARAFGTNDERMLRREHSYFKAYSVFGKLVVAVRSLPTLISGDHNPIYAGCCLWRCGDGIVGSPSALFMAIGLLYLTLPQAILIWTEPDMEEAQ